MNVYSAERLCLLLAVISFHVAAAIVLDVVVITSSLSSSLGLVFGVSCVYLWVSCICLGCCRFVFFSTIAK